MDAHSKAMRLHRDPSPGNIILYREPDNPVRVGYLIDWEHSCKVGGVGVRDHILVVSFPMRSQLQALTCF